MLLSHFISFRKLLASKRNQHKHSEKEKKGKMIQEGLKKKYQKKKEKEKKRRKKKKKKKPSAGVFSYDNWEKVH